MTKEEIENEIKEIYNNAPYQGRHGLLVGDGSSQRYWELKAKLNDLRQLTNGGGKMKFNYVLSDKAKSLYPDYELSFSIMGEWKLSLVHKNNGYILHLATGASEIHSLVSLQMIIELWEIE